MFYQKRNGLLVIIGLVLLIASPAMSRARKLQRIQPGVWGGQHISIEFAGPSASIDYDCAHGTIDGPLTVDSKGRFSWRGIHTREHGGPVRRNEKSNNRPAVYTGWIQGNTMTLTVTLADTNEVLDKFTLTRGSPGRVFKCK
ncbi:MAG TPA: hypothetical protein DHU55_01530 [Blastocatellia bacterium]|jgi:hypothetical protein|nr:hypothetical protein [Blastocatellia bacterium]HCX28446.1 hypothetical protein [Blastocatellia bacterium]